MFDLKSPELLGVVFLGALVASISVVVLWTRAALKFKSRSPQTVQDVQSVESVVAGDQDDSDKESDLADAATDAEPIPATRRWSGKRIAQETLAVIGRFSLLGLAILLCQALLFIGVNKQFGFYASWNDLLGIRAQGPKVEITAAPPSPVDTTTPDPARDPAAKGSLEKIQITGAHGSAHTLVWLPPGYSAQPDKKYPVMFFLPGQPAEIESNIQSFEFEARATELVKTGKVKPFIGVFPPIMIAPPRDTQCIDVPGGPQAEKWIISDVAQAIQNKYRVEPPGKHWSMLGFSTGGYCATKIVLRHPTMFSAVSALAANLQPYADRESGDLFGGSTAFKNENSPLWIYPNKGTQNTNILVITAGGDGILVNEANRLKSLAGHDPNVQVIIFGEGGHNFTNYVPYVPQSLEWLQSKGAFG